VIVNSTQGLITDYALGEYKDNSVK